MAPKQKIRIKLRSYWVPLIEDSCKQILDAARNTNAKTMGPVPLPTKKRIYCVLKSPHVHKDARFHFEIRTHQRMIDILYPTAQTIDSLMQLDLPAGVDVEVKLWRSTLTTMVNKQNSSFLFLFWIKLTLMWLVSELNAKIFIRLEFNLFLTKVFFLRYRGHLHCMNRLFHINKTA